MHTEPVESLEFPGYWEIPGFSDYVISKAGVVLNKLTHQILDGSTNPAGYHHFRLKVGDREYFTIGRHRLLSIVFKPTNADYETLYVNHLNGVKGDDALDNLEWCTPIANVEHAGAMGLSPKCIPISVRDVDTGEVVKYPSIVKYARLSGLSKDAVAYRVHCGEERIFPERKQYRASHSDDPWPTIDDIRRAVAYGRAKQVQCRYVLTDLVVEFESCNALAVCLGIKHSTLSAWLCQKGQPVLPGFIQVKWANDDTPWRNVGDPYLELSEFTGNAPVLVTHSQTGESQIYTSAASTARAMGLNATTLHQRLQSGGAKFFSDGYSYAYYTKQNSIHHVRSISNDRCEFSLIAGNPR